MEVNNMWIIIILAVIFVTWQIGFANLLRGIKNGARRTVNYVKTNRRKTNR